MVCPNCKHELNPQARVCPTCGTPVAAPTVVITPPLQDGAPVRSGKKYVSAARVFAVIFCLLAVALNGALVAFWFLPSIRVMDSASPSSVTLFSMHDLCHDGAPYLSIVLIACCVISVIFCLLPLFKHFANKRCMMIVPKLMTLLCAGCYAVPYLVASIASTVTAVSGGGEICHSNPFTTICLGLYILLWITGGLTSRNRYLVQRHRIETLEAQLTACGVRPAE